MKNLSQIISDYRAYHTQPITKYTHYIGVPTIVFSLMIFLSWISISIRPIINISLMWVVIIYLSLYYIKLDKGLGFSIALVFFLLGLIAGGITQYSVNKHGLLTFLFMFILGWIVQLLGHQYEGRKPAFYDNLMQVFAAPIFIALELSVLFGLRKDLDI